VFVSGIFFSGPPHRILRAWGERRLALVYSRVIVEEYERVLDELSRQFAATEGLPFLALLARHGELVQPDPVVGLACRDPADVKFVECLLRSEADWLITGDKDLLEMKVEAAITTPRRFCDRYL